MTPIDSICVIDDDPIVVFGIRKMLQNALPETSLIAFENGRHALDYMQAALDQGIPLPRHILLDINMPIMDGWQFLEAFIGLPIPMPMDITIITSSIDPSDYGRWETFRAITHHRLEYKNKPIRKDDLIAIVSAA
ncbi:response regulator [Robiginitalea sp. M366]|uniref:response regulator n=1 Tax=Robiginitalea aestuariiviva TaxID=3036903 RepID=UPI00240E0AAF|nr:response regulator [Robiginitalea aestuariiviva]MDG1570737.1 response regulator [Robiginitalea aestuariiviva]